MMKASNSVLPLRILGGLFIANLGNWVALLGLWAFAAYKYHVNAQGVTAITAAWAIPSVVFAPLISIALSRVGPRIVLTAGMWIASATALAMMSVGSYALLLVFGSTFGVARAMTNPSIDSLPRWMVPEGQLFNANAKITMATESAMILGPGLAAILVHGSNLRFVFGFSAIAFAFGALAMGFGTRVRVDAPLTEASRFNDPPLRRPPERTGVILGLMGALYLVWSGFLVLEPLFVRDVLRKSQVVFAMLQATYAIGLVVTSIMFRNLSPARVSRGRLSAAVVVAGLGAALYLGTQTLLLSFAGIFLWGAASAVAMTVSRTLVQRGRSKGDAARIASWNRGFHAASELVLIPLAGLVASTSLGPSRTGVMLAAASIAVALLLMRLDIHRSRFRIRISRVRTVIGDNINAPSTLEREMGEPY